MDLISQKVRTNLTSLNINNTSILIALSGGKDSMSLLNILRELKDEFKLELSAAYINHNLRGKESEKEEKFVSEFCSKNKIQLYKKIIEKDFWKKKDKSSVEMIARNERYDFFKKLCREEHIFFIATAHHLDDKIETFFLNLLRGGAVENLSSIPEKNNNIIRPFINITRKEIEEEIKSKKIPHIEDSSNKKKIYKRNLVRNELIPVIKKIAPDYIKSFEHFFKTFSEEKKIFNGLASGILKKISVYISDSFYAVNLEKYKTLNPALQKNIIKKILSLLHYPVKPNRNMLKLLSGNKIKYLYKCRNFSCLTKSSLLWFINKEKLNKKFYFTVSDFPSTIMKYKIIKTKKDNIKNTTKTFAFDLNETKLPLTVRSLSNNDSILITKNNLKKISSILSDNKIPKILFPEVIVFEDAEKKIAGFIFDELHRVSCNLYLSGSSNECITAGKNNV